MSLLGIENTRMMTLSLLFHHHDCNNARVDAATHAVILFLLLVVSVLPFLYGTLNGGRVSETTQSEMSSLLDLIRYFFKTQAMQVIP